MDLLFQAHRLYNDLIALYRERADKIRGFDNDALKAKWAEIKTANQSLRDTRDAINTLRGSKPATGVEAHQDQISALKQEGQDIQDSLKELGQQLRSLYTLQRKDPAHKILIDAVYQEYHEKLKVCRRESGLYWGNYNAVFASAEQADKTCIGKPRFKRWEGEGTLAVQVQNKDLQVPATLFGNKHTLIQIDPVDPRAWDPAVRKGERRRLCRTTLRVRVGSDPKRDPVFLEFPMIMHRPLPEGALVSGLKVTRRRHANQGKWTVQMTVNLPETANPDPQEALLGRGVAIDFGWRMQEDRSLRVAYWADTDGNHGEFLLPTEIREGLAHARNIRGVLSQHLDALKAALLEDLSDRAKIDPELREEVVHLHKWRSPHKFMRLWHRHRDALMPHLKDRSDLFLNEHCSKYPSYFERWVHQSRHLWQYEVGTAKRCLRRRDDLYANIAARLAREYDYIVLENIKIANLAKKPKAEKKADLPNGLAAMNNSSRSQRTEVAPGMLRSALTQAAIKAGRVVVKVPAQNTSKTCHKCGHKCALTHLQFHTCESCGATWDRDFNAATNILARGQVVIGDPAALEKADLKPKPRAAKFAKRHKSEITDADLDDWLGIKAAK